jgi:PEP-CTERM motif
MKLKFAAALAALTLSGAAMAANTSITVTVPDILDTLELGYTIGERTVLPGDSFTDYYKFSIGATSDVFGSVVSAKTVNAKKVIVKDLAFDSISLTGTSFSGSRASETPLTDFLFSNLSEGSYIITLMGHATASLGGSYHGELIASPAVPEPATLVLTLAGISAVGLIARRRKVI